MKDVGSLVLTLSVKPGFSSISFEVCAATGEDHSLTHPAVSRTPIPLYPSPETLLTPPKSPSLYPSMGQAEGEQCTLTSG